MLPSLTSPSAILHLLTNPAQPAWAVCGSGASEPSQIKEHLCFLSRQRVGNGLSCYKTKTKAWQKGFTPSILQRAIRRSTRAKMARNQSGWRDLLFCFVRAACSTIWSLLQVSGSISHCVSHSIPWFVHCGTYCYKYKLIPDLLWSRDSIIKPSTCRLGDNGRSSRAAHKPGSSGQ